MSNLKLITRYFQVTDEKILGLLRESKRAYEIAANNLNQVAKEKWGVKTVYSNLESSVSVDFDERVTVDVNLWRKHKDADRYSPRRDRKVGKALRQELLALLPKKIEAPVYKALGFGANNGPVLIHNGRAHYVGISYGVPLEGKELCVVIVPWICYPDEELQEYESGDKRWNANLNWILKAKELLKNEALTEIKGWQYHKLVDDYNAAHVKKI